MMKPTHLRTWLAVAAVALCALVLSACSSNEENKNTATANKNAAATSTPPAAPAANTNTPPPAPTANANNAANANKNAAATAGQKHTAVIETAMGKITIELLDKDAPKTVENFRKLASSGFYNGLVFHRTISGFMIQGGDPNGNGSGGRTADGQKLPNEVNRSSPLYQGGYARGLVAMANRGGDPTTGSSQFFIMHKNYALPPDYTIFGRVVQGLEVVDKIASAPIAPGATDRPSNPVKMIKVTVQ